MEASRTDLDVVVAAARTRLEEGVELLGAGKQLVIDLASSELGYTVLIWFQDVGTLFDKAPSPPPVSTLQTHRRYRRKTRPAAAGGRPG